MSLWLGPLPQPIKRPRIGGNLELGQSALVVQAAIEEGRTQRRGERREEALPQKAQEA